MNEVVRSKKGLGDLFNEENRLRVGGKDTSLGLDWKSADAILAEPNLCSMSRRVVSSELREGSREGQNVKLPMIF